MFACSYKIVNHYSSIFPLSTSPSVKINSDLPQPVPCTCLNHGENYKRAKPLYNASFTLVDIDRTASKEIPKYNFTNISSIDPKIIIIVPYGNPQIGTLAFLIRTLPYFRYQRGKVEILTAEQNGTRPFNRARLFRAAISDIKKYFNGGNNDTLFGSTCFTFCDVDKLPKNPDAQYFCADGPNKVLRF